MTDRNSVAGKRVLVTGGTAGIGRATVAMFAKEGAHVMTFGRHQSSLDESLADAAGVAGSAEGLIADVATAEDMDRVFAAVDDKLGGIDLLVTCAAIGAEPLYEMAEDDWRRVIETNLIGTLAAARRAIPRMEAQGGGQLIFVGSISVDIKKPGESVYAATKAGIQAFAETLHKEVADKNIKVSVIEPGSVATPMQECSDDEKAKAIADHEMLFADDVAEAILFAATRSAGADIVNLRIEPVRQKTH
ncbi:SDR family oxidoreductase [Sphingomonas endolithica]|uniref:SDR family oxidoreductase n=1 Tax=Sphingomonas endolithica TaxID=2972485 RepID=UPI0021AF71FF|nr:SDR family oxidoreductase [Sphingomonas sp. ZFBP2030]